MPLCEAIPRLNNYQHRSNQTKEMVTNLGKNNLGKLYIVYLHSFNYNS